MIGEFACAHACGDSDREKAVSLYYAVRDGFLDGQWLKATPAFNRQLCEKSDLRPLEFDGHHDSIFHEYEGGRQHMQYLKMHGSFEEIPLAQMIESYRVVYPHWDLKTLASQ